MSSDIELNEIGVLKRREIEARILAPILEALGNEFGREQVLEITRRTIVEIARRKDAKLRNAWGATISGPTPVQSNRGAEMALYSCGFWGRTRRR